MTSPEAASGAARTSGPATDVETRVETQRVSNADSLVSGLKQAAAVITSSTGAGSPLAAGLVALADRLQGQRVQVTVRRAILEPDRASQEKAAVL